MSTKLLAPKENLIRAITFDNPDHVPYYGEGGQQGLSYEGAWPPGEGGVDIWDVEWKIKDRTMLPYTVDHPLKNIRDWENYEFPDPHKPGIMSQLKTEIDKENNLVVGKHPFTLFERAWALTGMDNLLIAMKTDPQKVKKLLKNIADYQIEIAKQYVEVGVEAGGLSDDYGGQNALLVSPETWREFFGPELARIVKIYKDANLFVFFHCCGHIMDIVEDFIDIGVDVLNPIQARANDLSELKKKYHGQIAFSGGIDTQYTLMLGTLDEVRSETHQRIKELAWGGGYIVGPDQEMPWPKRNIDALVQTAKEFGKYPLKDC